MLKNIHFFITNKLNRSTERSSNAIKNIITSFLVKGISIAVSFLLVPLTINYINPTQYGVWLTLSSIVAWFSLFDIGLGNGLRNRFTEAKATGNYAKAKSYISTTYICLGAIFTIVWIFFFIANFFIDWNRVLNVPKDTVTGLSLVAIVTFTFFCIQIILRTISTVLIADQKPAKSAFYDMLGQALTLLFIFILIQTTSGSLFYLALALGTAPVLVMLFSSFWLYNHEYKSYKPTIHLFEKSIVRDILTLGSKFFLIQIAFVAIYQTTIIIIAQVSTPDDVTIYNIAFKYFSVVMMVSSIILAPFWSAFTEAYTLKDFRWMKNIYQKLVRTILLLCLLVLIMLAVSSFAYHLWIGNQVTVPIGISLIVALYVIFFMLNSLNSQILNGIGKIKFQLLFSSLCIFINIPLAWFLGKKMGIVGVVLPSVILNMLALVFGTIQVRLILNRKAKGIWNK